MQERCLRPTEPGSELVKEIHKSSRPQTEIPGITWRNQRRLSLIHILDGTEQDYVHHELFHKFMEHKQHGEGQLLEKAQRAIDYDSDRWIWYLDGCEKDYRNDFTLDIVYEEITGDLCEYAMSGSETMRNRLEGLFLSLIHI